MQRGIERAVWAVSTVLAVSNAGAQWTAAVLHPPGATRSMATAFSGGQQVGLVDLGAGNRAAVWNGTAASCTERHPAGAASSSAYGVSGGRLAGCADFGGGDHAGLWDDSPGSWVDLHPAGAVRSHVFGVSGDQQAGAAYFGFPPTPRAGVWTGTVASWVQLSTSVSQAWDVLDGQQAGYAYVGGTPHASLWTGTAASRVDLHPPGAQSSYIEGISATHQAGYVTVNGVGQHASLWNGSPTPWVDLHPTGAWTSGAKHVWEGYQVGWADFAQGTWPPTMRASLWSGSAASRVDLHALLPAGYAGSIALRIRGDAAGTHIVGYAFRAVTGDTEAILWKQMNCYPDCTADGALTVADFGCFQTKFVAADPYADCNADGQRTVADFGCFQTKFVAGCP